ncbi:MAG: 3-hydroxy-9,10-secoandrosta,3,5(10)-triene-9,17-dione monooxygenase [Solirubrobacteraceae bacterium]|nr:3-hydroxy-9,10-secoandrosta,3,5(10)-triene-9,17-dione monooxygenase [Solirubrobacteraceae bacterium]
MPATADIAPPEPGLTPDVMLERARALVPILRERQAATEAAGRVLDETQAALIDAGLYRAMQPRRFGGYEFGLRDFVRVMTEISRGCPSTGWSVTLTAGHPHLLSHWNEQAQAEIYGDDGDARVPGRPVQFGTAIPADGGYTVTGTWDYASGCDHATHFMGSAVVPPAEDAPPGPPRLTWLLLDRDDFAIVDNWDVIGLRGSGSKRVTCEGVFVPEHRVITAVGTAPEKAPGWRSHPNKLFAGGLFSFLFFEFGAIAVGTARGAIDVYEEILRTKAIDVPPFVLRGEAEEYRHHLGEAIGRVDVAEAALMEGMDRYVAQATRAYDADEPVDENGEETRRLLVLQQQSVRMACEAVDLLFRTGGTSSARRGHPLGNAMVALQIMRTHMGLQWDRTFPNLGSLRLGQEAGFV